MTLLIRLLALVAVLFAGCSLQTYERSECSDNSDCAAFGNDSTCNPGGYCTGEAMTACSMDAECATMLGEGATCVNEMCIVPCTTNAQCRAENGLGSVCGANGECAQTDVHPRCQSTYPNNLFGRLDEFGIVAGNLMDRSLDTHVARENSARLAFLQATEQSGIGPDGKPTALILCDIAEDSGYDSLTRNEAAVDVAAWLSNEVGVPAIIGPASSGDTQSVFGEVRDSGTLVISPSATSPALTGLDELNPTDDTPGLLWRTAPPDSIQGRVLANDLLERGVTMVTVVYENGAYGEGLLTVFTEEFSSRGGTVVGTAHVFEADRESGRSEAIAAAGGSVASELLFISSQTSDAIALINIATGTNTLDGKDLLLTDSAANSDFLDALGTNLPGRVRGTRPAPVSGGVYTVFNSAYAGAYDGASASDYSYTAQAFDAAWMVLAGAHYALSQDDSLEGLTIARGMRKLSSGTAFDLRASIWPSIKNSLGRGDNVNLVGASGPLDFDPATEETTADIQLWGPMDCDGDITFGTTLEVGGTLACE